MGNFGPTLLVIGAAALTLPYLNPRDTRTRAVLFGACLVLAARYVVWRLTATLPPFGWHIGNLFAWTFASLEAVSSIGWSICFITLIRVRDRSAEATANEAWLLEQPQPPRVAVLITTYNEEESILQRSIVGALAIDYPALEVCVLDDGRRDWLRRLCEAKGARHLTRPDNSHAKAGNINHAIELLKRDPEPPEFVAVFDADFVAHPEFLLRTMALFRDPKIGLVQTPQHFFNNDPIQSNLLIGPVWPDEQRFFFDHVQPAKDAWGAPFCCGTSWVMRMAALDDIGGFPTNSVTEDVLVTLGLDIAGWRTVYLDEKLSTGLAAEGMKEYVSQRGRWCLGLMQIMRSSLAPWSRRPMRLAYRIGLVDSFLYWAGSYSFKLACFLAPIIYWYTGLEVIHTTAGEAIRYFLPYYTAVMIALGWATGGVLKPLLTDVGQVLTMFEALKATAIGLAWPHGHKFKVTAKGGQRDRLTIQWEMLLRFGVLAGLTLGGVAYASLADFAPSRQGVESHGLVLFWSAYNVLVLLLAMSVCVELPRYRREERFATGEAVRIRDGDKVFGALLGDLSIAGARVRAPLPAPIGTFLQLTLDQVGEIPARIVYGNEAMFTLEFVVPEGLRDALIRKLFSGRYGVRGRVDWRHLLGALTARALR
jgi:cellulose synthase/poly-beta-1,6-N-acetylglucosamine synthase-like glycosyltransferase